MAFTSAIDFLICCILFHIISTLFHSNFKNQSRIIIQSSVKL